MFTIKCPLCLRELQLPSASPEQQWECPLCGGKFNIGALEIELQVPPQRAEGQPSVDSHRAGDSKAFTVQVPSPEETSPDPRWEPPKRLSTFTRRIFRDADRSTTLRLLNVFGWGTLVALGLFVWAALRVNLALLCLAVFAAPCLGVGAAIVVESFYILIKGGAPRDEESAAYEVSRRLQKRPAARRSPYDSRFGEEPEHDGENLQDPFISTHPKAPPDEARPTEPMDSSSTNIRPE